MKIIRLWFISESLLSEKDLHKLVIRDIFKFSPSVAFDYIMLKCCFGFLDGWQQK